MSGEIWALGAAGALAFLTATRRGGRSVEETRDFGSYSWGETPEKVIRWALKYHMVDDPYPMDLVGTMEEIVEEANERAGLEPERFVGRYGQTGLRYTIPQMICLLAELKRMEEEGGDGDDSPGLIRGDILTTIGIEEI